MISTPEKYELLDWDSEFLGVRVARIIPPKLDFVELGSVLEALRYNGVSLAYWAADGNSEESASAARDLGGMLVDNKVTYIADLSHFCDESFREMGLVEEYDGDFVTEEMERLAIQSGEYSRFRVDPFIPQGKFEALYRHWIAMSVAGVMADVIMVIRNDADMIVGMITLRKYGDGGDIGLVAVDPGYRGKGYGRLLVMSALRFFFTHGCRYAQVVTQEQNIPACKLYEAVGCQVEKYSNFFHFWLDS